MPGNPIVHVEIGCRDGGKTREFFSRLFDWEISGPEGGFMIDAGGPGGVTGHIAELAEEWGSYQIFYVQVEDLEASLAKAEELGGKTLVPPVELPGRGSFAWLASPEGNVVGLWKPT
jgi:predicted enzyme related to lactoylglutathione lyase